MQTNKAGEGNWNLTPPVLATDASNASNSQAASADSSDNTFIALKTLDITDARIQYQDGSQAITVINLPKAYFGGSDGKALINIDAQYQNYVFNLKGNTGSLRGAYFAWDQAPVNLDLDLNLTLNGKSLAITGDIIKNPKVLPKFNIKLNSKSFDLAPLAVSAAAAGSVGKGVSMPAHHQSPGNYFFSDKALPFGLLPLADGLLDVDIAQLGISGQVPLSNFKAALNFQKNRIDANNLRFNIGNGSAQGQISISQFDGPAPKVIVKGLAKDFTLEQIVKSADSTAKVSGGPMQVALNLQGSGLSPHQILGRANGAMQLSVGQSKLDSAFLNKGGDFLITVFDAINPLYKKSNQTVLECAVAYLPMNNGMVNIQDSIGVETDRLNVILSGSINLGSEALNLNINPSEKSGLTTGVDLGGLVKVEGTLQNPKAAVNKSGVVTSAVSIGLGFLTGGISIAAENAKSLVTKSQPCKAALRPWSEIYSAGN